jgi:hypothetical protein
MVISNKHSKTYRIFSSTIVQTFVKFTGIAEDFSSLYFRTRENAAGSFFLFLKVTIKSNIVQ